jgi:formylglycine-generating enzyme required for sulfatase activity
MDLLTGWPAGFFDSPVGLPARRAGSPGGIMARRGIGFLFGLGAACLVAAAPAAHPEERVAPSPACEGVRAKVAGAERCLTPKDAFRDCPDCPEMVVIRAGRFTMGSPPSEPERADDEGPQHEVTIPKPFAIGRFEVTFVEWEACVSAGECGGHRPSDRGWGKGSRPVIDVSWDDAKAYAAWLSRKTGEGYRLLSEAEWEYAARAGTTTPFSTGERITADEANFDGNHSYNGSRKGVYRMMTVPVGSFAANAFGLHDMHGNVWEWVEDCYQDNYDGAPTDASASTAGTCRYRVLRGGAWLNLARSLRSAERNWDMLRLRNSHLGFRIGFRVFRTL